MRNPGQKLDLVLLHFPKAALFKSLEATVQEQWRAIVAFADAGNARSVGVSQFCATCLGYLDGAGATGPFARPQLHQFGWHVGMGADPQGIVRATAARGDCVAMAYSPLAEAAPAILSGEPVASIAKARTVLGSWAVFTILPNSKATFCGCKTPSADSHCCAPLRLPLPPAALASRAF